MENRGDLETGLVADPPPPLEAGFVVSLFQSDSVSVLTWLDFGTDFVGPKSDHVRVRVAKNPAPICMK